MTKSLLKSLALASLLFVSPHLAKAEVSDQEFSKLMKSYLSTEAGRESIGDALEAYAQDAQKRQVENQRKEFENQFKNPVKIDIGSSPVKGPANAKFTIIEFSDFECPYCKKGKETMEQVMKAYPGEVKLVFKHLPLPFHQHAKPAALASLAANKQGKFWEFHDKLFENQRMLSNDFYLKTATDLGLNVEQFKKDLADPAIAKQVEEESKLAGSLGIQGTPAFYVNGVGVKGAYPVEHFKMIIDRLKAGK